MPPVMFKIPFAATDILLGLRAQPLLAIARNSPNPCFSMPRPAVKRRTLCR
jgi:hypothetical protein